MRRLTSYFAVIAGLFFGSNLLVSAQSYDLSWHTIAGGGGTSTSAGGQYSVSGTIGQPAAGTLSGGSYSLTGGFWGIIAAIQTPGSPLLSVKVAGANVVLSWPSGSTGFALQQNSNVATTNWNRINMTTYPTVVSNGFNTVTLPVSGNQYFRLINP